MTILVLLLLREIRAQVRSWRFILLTGVACLLAPLIVIASVRDFRNRTIEHNRLLEQLSLDQSKTIATINIRQPDLALRVVRVPEPLSVVVRGLDAGLPQYSDFGPAGEQPGASSVSRVPDLFSTLDLAFLIRIVLGLLAVTLAADSLAAERQNGTMLMLVAQPVTALRVISAKLLGGCAALTLAVVLLQTAVLAALLVSGGLGVASEAVPTLAALSTIAVVFLSSLYAIGLISACLTHSTTSANVVATACWLVLAVASTPAPAFVSNLIVSIPSMEREQSRRLQLLDTRLREIEELMGRRFVDLAGASAATAQGEFAPEITAELEGIWRSRNLDLRSELASLEAPLSELLQRRQQVLSSLSLSSIGTEFESAAAELCGTGLSLDARWTTAIRQRQRDLESRLFDDPPRLTLRVPIDRGFALVPYQRRAGVAATSLASSISVVRTFPERLTDALGAFSVLLTYAAILTTTALMLFRRYGVSLAMSRQSSSTSSRSSLLVRP